MQDQETVEDFIDTVQEFLRVRIPTSQHSVILRYSRQIGIDEVYDAALITCRRHVRDAFSNPEDCFAYFIGVCRRKAANDRAEWLREEA
jgi:hypothetical protein